MRTNMFLFAAVGARPHQPSLRRLADTWEDHTCQTAAPSRDVDGGHPEESAQDSRITITSGRPRRAPVPEMRGQGKRKGQGNGRERRYAAQRAIPWAATPAGVPKEPRTPLEHLRGSRSPCRSPGMRVARWQRATFGGGRGTGRWTTSYPETGRSAGGPLQPRDTAVCRRAQREGTTWIGSVAKWLLEPVTSKSCIAVLLYCGSIAVVLLLE